MEKKDFDIFKERVLVPYLDEIKMLDEVNCLKINYERLDKIYWNYQKMRDIIKKEYMEKNTQALDRHKVGSCIIYAILCAKIISVNKNIPKLPPHLLMANEYYAVNVAINVVEMYKLTTEDNCDDYKIELPISRHEKKEIRNLFLYELCVGLYEQNIKRCFNFFAYSTILFQLEDKTDYIRQVNKQKK